jgi:hypothetical protein
LVKHRGILAIVGVVVLATASTLVALQVHAWLYGLSDPASADREGLLRWLVLADLEEQPRDVCRTLVDRFEEVFVPETAADAPADASTLTDEQIARVERNVAVLKEVWFFARVDDYWSLDAAARPSFLDRQVCNIFRCAEFDCQFHDSRGGDANGDAAESVGRFFDSIAQWRDQAPAGERERIREVVKAGLIRWLATHELSEQSLAVRRQVVAGLEKELGTKLSFGSTTTALAAAEAARFWRNVELLAESWFHAKANQFAALDKPRRSAFVAAQLSVVDELAAHWPAAEHKNSAAEAIDRLHRWTASSAERDRAAAAEFARALQAAWLARRLGNLWQ